MDSPQLPSLTLVFLWLVVCEETSCVFLCILVDCWLAGIGLLWELDDSWVSNWSPAMLAKWDAQRVTHQPGLQRRMESLMVRYVPPGGRGWDKQFQGLQQVLEGMKQKRMSSCCLLVEVEQHIRQDQWCTTSGARNLGNFFRLVLFTQSQTLHAKVFRVWVFYTGPRTLAKIRDFTLYFGTNLKPV